ncbi:FAD:protein FMN transferase [Deinococcus ruber]|uniref:FAD:protein FMN transferase n=1 Tax=Deinococcus ruber TaxID=1848197 RepID=A0A918FHC1_9DEIO|nr:FAD:protein FMN transferase [Deinococcus ruber]GGR37682.1 FAD:protein FMN transferase [Deinococcus ruber]
MDRQLPERSRGSSVYQFDATGTSWEIETPEPLGTALQQRIRRRVQSFEAIYSRFQPDSLLAQLADAPQGGRFEFPAEATGLFDLYDRLHTLTEGALDPLVGGDLERLGYDRSYSLVPVSTGQQLTRLSWARDVRREGSVLTTRRPLVLDLGAAGKGLLVDLLAGFLREAGQTRFVVDGSGDLRHAGPAGLQVGLEHPFNPRLVIGAVTLQNRALCASAINRRAWGDGLHHVLDARSGRPVEAVVATWVIADEAVIADGLATALFFTAPDVLAQEYAFSGVRMFADGRAEVSGNFDGEVFT